MVRHFAESGDSNPVHPGPDGANTTPISDEYMVVAHGEIVGAIPASDTTTSERVDIPTISPLSVDPIKTVPRPHWSRRLESVPALVMDHGEIDSLGLVIRAASIRGLVHDQMSEPRQDAYSVRVTNNVVHVVVCDGVGTRYLSHEGARIAADAAVNASIRGGEAREVVTAAVDAIVERAGELFAEAGDLASTMCWLRIEIKDLDQPWPIEIAQWGDTEVLCYDTTELRAGHPNWFRFAQLPETGMPSNVVQPLPLQVNPVYASEGSGLSWYPGQVLGVFTDGIAADVDFNTDLGHALAQSWYRPPSPLEFVAHVSFDKAGAGDDRTAVVLWRGGTGADGPAE